MRQIEYLGQSEEESPKETNFQEAELINVEIENLDRRPKTVIKQERDKTEIVLNGFDKETGIAYDYTKFNGALNSLEAFKQYIEQEKNTNHISERMIDILLEKEDNLMRLQTVVYSFVRSNVNSPEACEKYLNEWKILVNEKVFKIIKGYALAHANSEIERDAATLYTKDFDAYVRFIEVWSRMGINIVFKPTEDYRFKSEYLRKIDDALEDETPDRYLKILVDLKRRVIEIGQIKKSEEIQNKFTRVAIEKILRSSLYVPDKAVGYLQSWKDAGFSMDGVLSDLRVNLEINKTLSGNVKNIKEFKRILSLWETLGWVTRDRSISDLINRAKVL